MDERCSALYEAHVEFERKQWRGKTLEKRLKQEVTAFWTWAEALPLEQLSSANQISELLVRLVRETPVPEDVGELIGTVARHLVALPVNGETAVADVIDPAIYDQGVELLIDLGDLRAQAIHQAVNSPVYGSLVSEILYNGIRDYLSSDNAVTQKIPGMTSLINKGAGALSKRMPDLEKRLRGSVEKNLNRTVQQSEKFLNQSLTDERIRQIAGELWEMIQDSHLSLAEVVADEDVDAMIAFGIDVWLHLRQTSYLAELIDEGVAAFFDDYGETTIASLLVMAGIDKKLLQAEVLVIVPTLIAVLDESGFLETTIRRRLEPFYAAKTTAGLLS